MLNDLLGYHVIVSSKYYSMFDTEKIHDNTVYRVGYIRRILDVDDPSNLWIVVVYYGETDKQIILRVKPWHIILTTATLSKWGDK